MTQERPILAIDTATEQCSVAIRTSSKTYARVIATARGHAEMILPLVEEVLVESKLKLSELHGLAFGRGPGSFTGVRVAVGVAQGLALASRLPVVGISNLAAVAQRAAVEQLLSIGERVLVCMDARMQEAYWATYRLSETKLVELVGEEKVTSPDDVTVDAATIRFGAGTAWSAYPGLRERYAALPVDDRTLPRASEIAQLASREFEAGRGVQASEAQPVYLRDQVAWPAVNKA